MMIINTKTLLLWGLLIFCYSCTSYKDIFGVYYKHTKAMDYYLELQIDSTFIIKQSYLDFNAIPQCKGVFQFLNDTILFRCNEENSLSPSSLTSDYLRERNFTAVILSLKKIKYNNIILNRKKLKNAP